MNGTKSILSRIDNLISDDSKVLEEFNKRIEETNKNKTKAEEEQKSFEKEITIIQKDIDEISKASELSERFSNLDSYLPGLKKLGNSVSLLESINEELNKIPEQIEELENNIKKLTEKSDARAKIISESEDELSKLDVEISDAKRYQDNLIDLVNLAKTGDINKTREEVVETLVHVGFTDKEAVSAAKIILFPEDDLIPYFNSDNKAVEEEVVETVKEEVEEPKTEVEATVEEVKEEIASTEEAPIAENEEAEPQIEQPVEEVQETVVEKVTDEIEEPKVKEEKIEEEIDTTVEETPVENVVTEEKEEVVQTPMEESNDISLDEESSEITLESMDDDEKLSPVGFQSDKDYDSIRKILDDYGFDSTKFNNEDLDDEEIIRNNINFLLEKDINKEFVYNYPSIVSDKFLKNKYELIKTRFGKTDEDIRLTPEVIASYSKEDLEKLYEVVVQNNIDPKLIPLSVYLKGLQSFLRNYLVLKENNIEIDDNQLAKFAIILSINPVDFKKSLQILLDYKLSLVKNDGKVAIMDLAIKDSELANKMDMIINVGEEDLLKFYPEVLADDVKELVNRLVFLRNSDIPYKTQSHNKVIYQSFVLHQEVLDKVLEKHIDLNEVLDKDETNSNLSELINNEDIIKELDNIDNNFELISNSYIEDYKEVIKAIKGKYTETENAYVVGDYYFSKNKVNRDINYLASIFEGTEREIIIAASLLHDSRLSKEDMEKVLNELDIKVK